MREFFRESGSNTTFQQLGKKLATSKSRYELCDRKIHEIHVFGGRRVSVMVSTDP